MLPLLSVALSRKRPSFSLGYFGSLIYFPLYYTSGESSLPSNTHRSPYYGRAQAREAAPIQPALLWIAQISAGSVFANLARLQHDGTLHAGVSNAGGPTGSGNWRCVQGASSAVNLPEGILGSAMEPPDPQPPEAQLLRSTPGWPCMAAASGWVPGICDADTSDTLRSLVSAVVHGEGVHGAPENLEIPGPCRSEIAGDRTFIRQQSTNSTTPFQALPV